jgi:hypothetical protein
MCGRNGGMFKIEFAQFGLCTFAGVGTINAGYMTYGEAEEACLTREDCLFFDIDERTQFVNGTGDNMTVKYQVKLHYDPTGHYTIDYMPALANHTVDKFATTYRKIHATIPPTPAPTFEPTEPPTEEPTELVRVVRDPTPFPTTLPTIAPTMLPTPEYNADGVAVAEAKGFIFSSVRAPDPEDLTASVTSSDMSIAQSARHHRRYESDIMGTNTYNQSGLDSHRAWCAAENRAGEYIVIDMNNMTNITGIMMMGNNDNEHEYVTSVVVKWNMDKDGTFLEA